MILGVLQVKKNICGLVVIAFTIVSGLIYVSSNTFLGMHYGKPLEEIDPNVQWEFFEEQFISPEQAESLYGTGEQVEMPHKFYEHYDTVEMYGTYIAKVTLPNILDDENLAVFVPYQYGSYKLYIGNQLIAKNGELATMKEQHVLEMSPKIEQLYVDNREVYVTLQLSNYKSLRGGFSKPIFVGEYNDMLKHYNSTIIFHFFVDGIIFIVGVFALLVGWFNKYNIRTILFAMFCLIISIRSMFARPFIYSITVLNVPWEVATKIELACTILASFVAIAFLHQYFVPTLSKVIVRLSYGLLGIQLILTIFSEPILFQRTFSIVFMITLLLLLFILVKVFIVAREMNLEASIHFVGSLIILLSTIHDFIVVGRVLNSPLLMQYSQVIYVLLVVVFFSRQFAQKLEQEKRLNAEILELNASLDEKIKERTKQLQLANAQLEQLATKDALTGIANRYVFDEKIEYYFEKAKQTDGYLSLLLIDLDAFKKYNDHYGHIMGDMLLQKVVSVIGEQLPEEVLFARYGGEEFAIIYPYADEKQVEELGKKIVHEVAVKRFEHAMQDWGYVSVSVGGCTMSPTRPFATTKQLIAAADKQLYKVKHIGKNNFLM